MYKSIMYHGEVGSLNKVLLLTLKNKTISFTILSKETNHMNMWWPIIIPVKSIT